MNVLFKFLLLLSFGSLVACKVSEPVKQSPLVESDTVQLAVDTISVVDLQLDDLRLYRGERTRHFDLLHTRLEVRFDWSKQYLLGNARLELSPYFYAQTHLVLDAKNFDIHEIQIISGSDSLKPSYEYDGMKVEIDLGRSYARDEKLYLSIDYTAKPNEALDSLKISNDKKGLYFVNSLGSEPNKPQQIWTHGETNTSSRWFPTIDAPNQKTTQEIYITVDQKFKTLSNGRLVYSKSNPDSTRTDYWKMDKPHAPYLFMMAVGDFSVVEDSWGELPVNYYVEKNYEKYASDIFGKTPEMIDFFSRQLKFPYPWEKYSQVVVRDFVSGAMENTSASIFMEDLNVDSRELIDYNWDDIIAHELFHQWFGDLVTCESWANLPLNESFATYGEYLWKHHKYGRDEGDYHLYEELQTYLNESREKQRDLIRFDYLTEDEMFDSHSYAKGGLILHMLRNYIGDEAFFASLQHYLVTHAFGKAEVHELRLAFEQVTGEDLNWFFNQWFLDAGHPILKVESSFRADQNTYLLKVWQEQNTELYPVYKLPLLLDLWVNDNLEQYMIEVDRPYQEFEFQVASEPTLTIVDSEYIMVGEMNYEKTHDQWLHQYQMYDSSFRARYEAFQQLIQTQDIEVFRAAIGQFLTDPFWVIREEALLLVERDTTILFQELRNEVIQLASNDPHSLVRAAAISVLETQDRERYVDIYKSNLYDSSYAVAGNALYAYLQTSDTGIPEVLESLQQETSFSITSSIADYYIMNQDYSKFQWFNEKIDLYSGSDLWYFIKLYGMYIMMAPEEITQQGIAKLGDIAKRHSQFFNRLSAYQSLELLEDTVGVPELLEEIRRMEQDPRIIEYYK